MSTKLPLSLLPAILLAGSVLLPVTSFAQSGSDGCKAGVSGAQNILICPGGLTIVEENGARFTLDDRDDDGEVDLVRLWRKALLLELTGQPRKVEVVTPQAITAVRGTEWAVDAASGKTSVFVVNGTVGVRRPSAGNEVALASGDGVDVEPGAAQLQVKKWKAPRVAALMARFGR
jgi:hypothetical protein